MTLAFDVTLHVLFYLSLLVLKWKYCVLMHRYYYSARINYKDSLKN